MYDQVLEFIRKEQGGGRQIPLHEPRFCEDEIKLVVKCIKSGFVSSVGSFVDEFEKKVAEFCGVKFAVATVNGTSALHTALILAGACFGDEILTQPLTFVATVNAIKYTGASPVFIDVERDTLGLSPEKLLDFLNSNVKIEKNRAINKTTGRRIVGCVPMHTFGHPCKIDEIVSICEKYNIVVIEDAAESLGSIYKGKHTGSFGKAGILSFNGNKIITTGGGGMIITNDEEFAKKAKHLTTTAKIPHKWEYNHDCIGYNYRLPNINAALGCAQIDQISVFLEKKRILAEKYRDFFNSIGIPFVTEPLYAKSNYWLNSILFENKLEKEKFLNFAHSKGVMVRPAWRLMNTLEMFKTCQRWDLENATWIEERLVNIPSSVPS